MTIYVPQGDGMERWCERTKTFMTICAARSGGMEIFMKVKNLIFLMTFLLIAMSLLLHGCGSANLERGHRRTGMEDNPRFDKVDSLPRFLVDARREFEILILPTLIFEMKEDILSCINTQNSEEVYEIVSAVWFLTSSDVAIREFDLEQPEEDVDGALTKEVLLDFVWRLREKFDEYRYDLGLGDGHIVEVSFVEIDSNTGGFIIELHDLGTMVSGTFIGITYNESRGLNFFNLNRHNINEYRFIENMGGLRFANEASLSENSKRALISAIEEVMGE